MTAGPPILVDIADGVADVRFNRPQAQNALDRDMAVAFRDRIAELVADRRVRAILLSGTGERFIASGDLFWFRDAADRPQAARDLIAPVHEALLTLVDSGIPTVAAIHGSIAGGGMSIALIADIAVAADNAHFTMGYIKIASSPDCGGSWVLPRLVGRRKAAEIALLSEPIAAAEAMQLGLVNRVVPLAELHATARDIARRLAAAPRDAVRRTSRLLDAAATASLHDQLAAELDAFVEGAGAPDFDEAIAAIFERRSPRFCS